MQKIHVKNESLTFGILEKEGNFLNMIKNTYEKTLKLRLNLILKTDFFRAQEQTKDICIDCFYSALWWRS